MFHFLPLSTLKFTVSIFKNVISYKSDVSKRFTEVHIQILVFGSESAADLKRKIHWHSGFK